MASAWREDSCSGRGWERQALSSAVQPCGGVSIAQATGSSTGDGTFIYLWASWRWIKVQSPHQARSKRLQIAEGSAKPMVVHHPRQGSNNLLWLLMIAGRWRGRLAEPLRRFCGTSTRCRYTGTAHWLQVRERQNRQIRRKARGHRRHGRKPCVAAQWLELFRLLHLARRPRIAGSIDARQLSSN